MPLNPNLKKVMVIGSGPIVIGQAAEFDYAGTQACRALKEEGLEVVLVNSNPATIMTDAAMADHVYVEPLTLDFLKKIIKKEHLSELADEADSKSVDRRSDRPDAFDAAGKGRLSGTGGRYTSWRKPGNHCQSRRPSGF